MSDVDPFAPLAPEEAKPAAKKAKAEKVPIVPVPDDAPECQFKIPALGGAPVRMWAYRDAKGRLLGYDARFEYERDGQRQKDVMPVTFCQEGDKRAWRSRALPVPRPLYGLDRLAERPDAPVVIAEGAKSADAAGKLLPDYVHVSWPGGANAIGMINWRSLAGRDVLIWPDRDRHTEAGGAREKAYDDQPGAIAAANIIDRIKAFAASVHVLDLSDFVCKDGWDADDALADGWDAARAATFIRERAKLVDTDAPGTKMPFGFENAPDGLYFVEGENRRIFLSGRIKVLARTRDIGSEGWGLLLSWRDDDGVEHRWSMPRAMLAGDGAAIREELLTRGLQLATEPKPKALFLKFLASVDTPARARAVTQVGWSSGAFVLPHVTFGEADNERVILQNTDARTHEYKSAGTLESWQDQVAAPCQGNSRLVFALSAAFVGPILGPTHEEGGGVNYVGPSSCGKTTAIVAAASVWGPKKFMRNWKTTGNGLEGVAVQHSETLLCLDELNSADKDIGNIVYMLGNGQGKQRATRTAGARAVATWNVMLLSTGEATLKAVMKEAKQTGTMAGQEVRFLDVPADAGAGMGAFEKINGAESPEAFSRMLKGAAYENYGCASIAYLEELVAIRDTIGDVISNTIKAFISKFVIPGSDGQVFRGARRFGLVAAAGELAIALGILPWPRGEAFGAAGVMFDAWIGQRGGVGSAEDRNILETIKSFLQANGDSRFSPCVTDDGQQRRTVIDRAGFYRTVQVGAADVREYLFLPQPYKALFGSMDLKHVNKVLIAAGILRPDAAGKSSQSVRIPEFGQARCYVISGAGVSSGD
ncbi:DUF927 domain-containing protein [Sphingomonas paucimobilis]|uniref:DUF927 domain-containing protein n=1 Tax=Sphingomonas paucimobilis TaxID=13689 RepID=UPI0020420113|nr:DUF927 domain-containing protein [Sphingomonas paucimobilis]MCM3680240.1 DUF927 domain-containing protein [Sphingomonas paucimobilis]